jgi:hypothetical protein
MIYSIAAMSNLGQGYWECQRVEGTHTRDKGEKEKILSLHICSEFPRGFSSQGCGKIMTSTKFKWGQLVA